MFSCPIRSTNLHQNSVRNIISQGSQTQTSCAHKWHSLTRLKNTHTQHCKITSWLLSQTAINTWLITSKSDHSNLQNTPSSLVTRQLFRSFIVLKPKFWNVHPSCESFIITAGLLLGIQRKRGRGPASPSAAARVRSRVWAWRCRGWWWRPPSPVGRLGPRPAATESSYSANIGTN